VASPFALRREWAGIKPAQDVSFDLR